MLVPSLVSADARTPAVVPYCGVLDVLRLLFNTGSSSAEVCEVCQTINLGSVRFCKCCDAKMPAYYASLNSESSATRLQGVRVVHRIAGQAYAYALAGVGVAIVCATVYVALSHAQAQALSRPARASMASSPQPARLPGAAPVTRSESRVAFTAAPAAAAEAAALTAPEDVSDAPEPPAAARSRPPRRTVPARVLKPSPSRLAAAEASVARCEAMSFPLARAVCMNNRCAQPALVRSTVCVDAVRQRRIDEARRNPTLLG